jgi:hypothetical protein
MENALTLASEVQKSSSVKEAMGSCTRKSFLHPLSTDTIQANMKIFLIIIGINGL